MRLKLGVCGGRGKIKAREREGRDRLTEREDREREGGGQAERIGEGDR